MSPKAMGTLWGHHEDTKDCGDTGDTKGTLRTMGTLWGHKERL